MDHANTIKHVCDAGALVCGLIGVSTFFGLVSPIAGFFLTCIGIAWYVVQFRDRAKRKDG